MNPGLIFAALQSRIQADTGTGGLFNGGSYLAGGIITDFSALQGLGTLPGFPYLIATVDMKADDAFGFDGMAFTVTFELYSARNEGISAKVIKAVNRLYGDAMLQAGRIPTYGFHRFTPTLSSDSTLNPLSAVGHTMTFESATSFSQNQDAFVTTLLYEGGCSAPATSP